VPRFGAKGKGEEWLAVSVHPDRIDVAHVERRTGGRPAVQTCESYAKTGDALDTLKSIGRAVRPTRFRCSTLLSGSEYQMQQVEAPSVPRPERKAALRWKLKDLLDYPVDAATIDVIDVPADRAGSARTSYVYAISARNEQIAARMRLFRDAKFPLEVIDVPEMAQRNVARLFEESGRGLAMLAFDDYGGMLTVTAGGELYMARHTDITSEQLIDVRADVHAQTLERLVLELQRTLDHFDRQHNAVTLSRLLLAPLAADIGLEGHLAQNLDLPVQTLDLGEVLDFTGAPELRDPARQGYRLHIIGAALRDDGSGE